MSYISRSKDCEVKCVLLYNIVRGNSYNIMVYSEKMIPPVEPEHLINLTSVKRKLKKL